VEGAREDVRQRQEGHGQVVLAQRGRVLEGLALPDRVPMGQHDPLGLSGRPGRIDEGDRVLGDRLPGPLLEPGPVLLLTQLAERVERRDPVVPFERGVGGLGRLRVARVEQDELADARELVELDVELPPLVEVLDEQELQLRVVDDVAHLVGQVGLVDRDRDPARAQDPHVAERPLRARVREDPAGLALLEALPQERQPDLARGVVVALPAHVFPVAVDLATERRAVGGLRDPLAEEVVEGGRRGGCLHGHAPPPGGR